MATITVVTTTGTLVANTLSGQALTRREADADARRRNAAAQALELAVRYEVRETSDPYHRPGHDA